MKQNMVRCVSLCVFCVLCVVCCVLCAVCGVLCFVCCCCVVSTRLFFMYFFFCVCVCVCVSVSVSAFVSVSVSVSVLFVVFAVRLCAPVRVCVCACVRVSCVVWCGLKPQLRCSWPAAPLRHSKMRLLLSLFFASGQAPSGRVATWPSGPPRRCAWLAMPGAKERVEASRTAAEPSPHRAVARSLRDPSAR